MAVKRLMLSGTFRIALSVLIVFLGVLNIVNLSSLSTKGYDISDLQKQITSLERENQKLEFNIARHGSMQSIQERLKNMDMIAADNVEYATIVGNTVARR